MDSAINTTAILDILSSTSEKLSSSAVSRKLGYSKNRPDVTALLEGMAEHGTILREIVRGVRVFSYIPTPSSEEEVSGEPTNFLIEGSEMIVSTADDPEEVVVSLEVPETLPTGYSVVPSNGGFLVTFPDGKQIQLAAGERVIVIKVGDSVRRFKYSSADKLLELLNSVASEFKQFLVMDVIMSSYVSPSDLMGSYRVLNIVELSRHNKANKF